MLWLKAFHIIAMVAWFAGLFYLPRLFVYHANLEKEEQISYQRFCLMEKRLFWGIMTPAAILTILLGVGLVHAMHLSFSNPPLWLTLKMGLVALLLFFHGACGIYLKRFAHYQNTFHAGFYKLFNEIPTVILMGTVLLAVLKPT